MNESEAKPEKKRPHIYGVVGICGIVGNLTARVLLDRECEVIGTDVHNAEECTYLYTLDKYDLPLFLNEHPDSFFKNSTYIIPPPSLSGNSAIMEKIREGNAEILTVDDLLGMFKPEKPVLCITGTNGKTTTTNLLKHICRSAGLNPTEHGFRNLQGNIDYIPPLQARLAGDVAVLETGTFGRKGDLKGMMELCEPECGIVTNINPDHLDENMDFLGYASIKGEFIQYFKNKQLIVNSDDPTIYGLINEDHSNIFTFGVDGERNGRSIKNCWCGRDLIVEETIAGSGFYSCECGLNRPEPDYLAVANDEMGIFELKTPEGVINVEMELIGLHNIYNTVGAIVAAREFFKIPYPDILNAVKNFKGVPGRIEHLYNYEGMEVVIDYGHNPAGIGTVLREIKKVYERITVVITVSSESGEAGDIEILERVLDIADYIVPASFASWSAAEKFSEHISSGKIVLTDKKPENFKDGTLGANSEQVLEGIKKGLECKTLAMICLGEAAFKYKKDILEMDKNSKS